MPQGPSTRSVHAGRPPAERGAPLGPPLVLAAPYHLAGEAAPEGYGRYVNPTWTALEDALGALEDARALTFASGMAAIAALIDACTQTGDTVVVPDDGYYGVKALDLHGRTVRPVRTADVAGACEGAALVLLETPSNPLLQTADIAAVAEAAHAAGARLAVDNTLATPLLQRPLDLGADLTVMAGTKALSGHSDVLLGVVATRSAELFDRVLTVRSRAGAIPGPFEAWLAHRSLATLGIRVDRMVANAAALADALRARDDVARVWHPGRVAGPLVTFDLGTQERASAFLAACALVAEATSFGGVHSTAERRARWGTDDVGPGVIRLSAGIEDTQDLVADVLAALDASA